jgi:hypothetical protein
MAGVVLLDGLSATLRTRSHAHRRFQFCWFVRVFETKYAKTIQLLNWQASKVTA